MVICFYLQNFERGGTKLNEVLDVIFMVQISNHFKNDLAVVGTLYL